MCSVPRFPGSACDLSTAAISGGLTHLQAPKGRVFAVVGRLRLPGRIMSTKSRQYLFGTQIKMSAERAKEARR